MTFVKHCFSDLDEMIDRVHALFEPWQADNALPGVGEDTLYRTELALHEWLANLVQHADFKSREPSVTIEIWPDGDRVICTVEDNSDGFDFLEHLSMRRAFLEAFPERGMGLLMLQACATDLSYEQVGPHQYRLKFAVVDGEDPSLDIPF